MSSKGHRTKYSKLKTTQRLTQLFGEQLKEAFGNGPYPPGYILAVLPKMAGSAKELIVRSSEVVSEDTHMQFYNFLHDKNYIPSKYNVMYMIVMI